jgi:RES domain-containing protein
MPLKCCPNCFAHRWLVEFIRFQADQNGNCEFCGARQVRLISVEQLSELFANLLREYVEESYREEEIPAGRHHNRADPLVQALQSDWQVFSPVIEMAGVSSNLLDAILSADTVLKADSWVLRFSDQARRVESRFFDRMFSEKTGPVPIDEVRQAVECTATLESQVASYLSYFAVLIQAGSTLFRARSGCEPAGDRFVPHQDLGPNPRHPASRANSDGQCAFYLAEAERTAIAEVRQPIGARVSVGEFVTTRNLTVVDLCQSLPRPNPFVTKNLPWALDLQNLLRSIAVAMSEPAEQQSDYYATQLLTNIARVVGYHGVRFPSALDHSERNIVLFERDGTLLARSWVNRVLGEGLFGRA